MAEESINGGTKKAEIPSSGAAEMEVAADRLQPPAEAEGTNTKFCSSCGESSKTLKKCRACMCAWYCDASFQKSHWKAHKKECKRIEKVLKEQDAGRRSVATKRIADIELDVKDPCLFDMPPLREVCPVCMRVLPLEEELCSYNTCCGKSICCGCSLEQQMTTMLTNDEKEEKGQPLLEDTCAFCREPIPDANDREEQMKRLSKRIEMGDAEAIKNLAMDYKDGNPQFQILERNEAKALELFQKAADLGSPDACVNLGCAYSEGALGLEVDENKGRMYWEQAAKGGNVGARYNLGIMEAKQDNFYSAIRHWRISAAAGDHESVGNLIGTYEYGLLCHEDLAETMQARDAACIEMKSQERDKYIHYMKWRGERS